MHRGETINLSRVGKKARPSGVCSDRIYAVIRRPDKSDHYELGAGGGNGTGGGAVAGCVVAGLIVGTAGIGFSINAGTPGGSGSAVSTSMPPLVMAKVCSTCALGRPSR